MQLLLGMAQHALWHLGTQLVCAHVYLVLQVSDSYVGLDQTFWLDTFTEQAAQPVDSSASAAENTKGSSRAAQRKGDNHTRPRSRGNQQHQKQSQGATQEREGA